MKEYIEKSKVEGMLWAVIMSKDERTIKEMLEDAPIVNAIPIPDDATNGDMIKAMFPKAEFNNAMPFTDGRWETMNLDTENRLRAIYKPTQLRTYTDWWNAPYRKVEE